MRLNAKARELLTNLAGCKLISTHHAREEYCRLVNAGLADELEDRASQFLARVNGGAFRAPWMYQITIKGLVEVVGAPYQCGECGQPPEWRGRKLTLKLERIQHKITRFLCPNCEASLKEDDE